MKWIKTSDRLPKDEQAVLTYPLSEVCVFYKNHKRCVRVCEGKCIYEEIDCFQDDDYGMHMLENITHWMELPEDPEE